MLQMEFVVSVDGGVEAPQGMGRDEMERGGTSERLTGVVKRVRFESPERDFQVLDVETTAGATVTVVARNAALDSGERATFGGSWGERRGERQWETTWVERDLPTTKEAVRAYLEKSSFFRGVGEKRAAAIVDHFGADTLAVLDESPERLQEVAGLPSKVAETIAEEWGKRASVRAVLLFLQGHGISPALAFRIHQRYEARAVAVVREDPYRLARDVRGVGFVTADQIARALGIQGADPRRLRAGVAYALHRIRQDGHCRIEHASLLRSAAELLGVDTAPLAVELDAMAARSEVVYERAASGQVMVYDRETFELEDELARLLARRSVAPSTLPRLDLAGLGEIESELSFSLADGQRNALLTVMGASVGVLTGGPGTGKTTLIRAVTMFADRRGRLVRLAAPTGRAAKRMSESTGLDALTLHRLLEYDPAMGGFRRTAEEPLVCDLLIVDESSMLDLWLTTSLLRAVGEETSVLFVGDVDQLPSVGAGDVLRDLIESEIVPVARLRRVFRQGENSRIVDAAHAALRGESIASERGADGQYFFVPTEGPARIVERVVEVIAERMPRAFGLDPVRDVQVLVPMHSGPVGTRALNEAIGARLGGGGPALERGGNRFREGDRVMQTRNNYQLECFNGDIGFVTQVDPSGGTLRVDFGGSADVVYTREHLDDLVPAWAISVHKSQGSEFRAVVLVLSTHHHVMLQRNLVYTAITRARERLAIIGVDTAFRRALRSEDARHRETGLEARLRHALAWVRSRTPSS